MIGADGEEASVPEEYLGGNSLASLKSYNWHEGVGVWGAGARAGDLAVGLDNEPAAHTASIMYILYNTHTF